MGVIMAYEEKTKRSFNYNSGKKKLDDENKEYYVRETLEDVKGYPHLPCVKRGISLQTMITFGVRASCSEEDGETITAYYFPSHNQDGNITGYAKQDLTIPKGEKYHWSTIGEVTIKNKMFGQNVCESTNNQRKDLIITEGQWDCLTAYQARLFSINKSNFAGKMKPFVVSVPMGTKTAKDSVIVNKKFITSFSNIILHLDNDEATPEELKRGVVKGKEATQEIISSLIGEVKLSQFPHEDGYKDASDYLQKADGNREKAFQALELLAGKYRNAKSVSTEKIVTARDVSVETILKPMVKGIELTEFPKLNDMLYTLRPRELTLITASSGAGKTTVCAKIGASARKQNKKVGNIFLEESVDKTLQRYVASSLNVGFKEFRRNPLGCGVSEEKIREKYAEFQQDDNLVLLDHFGSLPIEELMSKIKFMHLVDGCDLIILDHLSMVISGSDITDERKELDKVMTALASFCSANDVHVVVVVHINRTGNPVQAPKGKEDEPFWVKINLNSLRGSGGLEQMAWNVLALEREHLPDRKRGRVRFTLLKNREGAELGEADTFKINPVNWEVLLCGDDDLGATNSVDMIAPKRVERTNSTPVTDDDDTELPF